MADQQPRRQTGMIRHFRAEYTPRQLKILAAYGIAAPLVYLTALIVGSILDPAYSQVGKTVSELFERGAPNRDLIDGIFVIYGVLLIPFAEGLYKSFDKRSSLAKTIFLSLLVISICGLAWNLFFPLDANGGYTSFTGMMHLVLSVPVVLATLLAELSFWKLAKNESYWAGYAKFSLAIFTLNLFAGLSLIVFVSSDIRGLLERFSIGSFLLWVEIPALGLYRTQPTTTIPRVESTSYGRDKLPNTAN